MSTWVLPQGPPLETLRLYRLKHPIWASVHSTCKKLSHRMLEVKRDAVLTADKGRFPSNIQYLLLQWMAIRLSLKRGQIKTRHTYSKSLKFAHSVQFSTFKPERTRQTKALSGNFLHVLWTDASLATNDLPKISSPMISLLVSLWIDNPE